MSKGKRALTPRPSFAPSSRLAVRKLMTCPIAWTPASRQARRAGESRRTVRVALGEVAEQLLDDLLLGKPADGLAARDERAVLAEHDHAVDELPDLLGLRLGGLHLLVAEHGEGQVPEHRLAMSGLPAELPLMDLMRHPLTLLVRGGHLVLTGVLGAGRGRLLGALFGRVG